MNQYTALINYIVSLLNKDIDVTTITEGNIDRIDLSKKNIYPLAHIDANDGIFTDNHSTFNVSIQIVDQIDYNNEINNSKLFNNDNRVDIYNTSLQSLRRLFNEFTLNKEINVSPDSLPSFQKVDEKKSNLIGWELSIVVNVPNDIMSICP